MSLEVDLSKEFEKLVNDYNRDNAYIQRQKRKWLPPPKRSNSPAKPRSIQDEQSIAVGGKRGPIGR